MGPPERPLPADADAAALVTEAIELLDTGQARVAEVDLATDEVVVHEWLKKSILMLFALRGMETVELGPFEYADKLPLKHGFAEAGVRAVPGASARWGSFLGRGVVLMPSYVNIGAWVGAGSMVDTWATVASCAQIGERVHLAGGVAIGGVLEPPNAVPVVVEDDAFVGSGCMVTGGRIGRAWSRPGSFLDPSIPVIDAETGEEISRGVVPPWCVAIRASRRREYPGGEFFVPCVLVIKRLSEGGTPRQGAAHPGPPRPRRQHLIRVSDLLAATGTLMAVPSLSGREAPLADLVERELSACPGLLSSACSATTWSPAITPGHGWWLVLVGHLDTVPPARNQTPRFPDASCGRRCQGI